MNKSVCVMAICFLLPCQVLGQIVITEIMYDPIGSETKKEWVELYNAGDAEIDLEGWKIFEGSNRSLLPYAGGMLLGPGAFAIIARDGMNFSGEYPDYKGIVFESPISLLNSGEEISLIDREGKSWDKVIYSDIAEEGHSIEIKNIILENSDMLNWIQGELNGSPGKIKIADQIPEFSFSGMAAIIVAIGLFIARKNT